VEAALRAEVLQVAVRKLLIMFTAAPAAVRAWEAAQPKPRKAVVELRIQPAARVPQRLERPAWLAQQQLEAQPKPSRARARRRRVNHILESIPKKTN
jgi:hypothetical protein